MAKPRIVQRATIETKEIVGRFPFRYLGALGFFACALVNSTVTAAQHRPSPQPVLSGTVQAIVDGDTLILRSGVQVRLVGIQGAGSKNRRCTGVAPAPGPPCKNTTGIPSGFPDCSQYITCSPSRGKRPLS